MSSCSSPKAPPTSDCNGNWTVQYSGCNGQVKEKTFPTKEAAEQNIQQYGKGQIVAPGGRANKYTGGC
jgi:hypothetical protein